MRILFVDDENSVLEGIENRLRKYRKRWAMGFSCGGSQALEMMAKAPFDAVVSDMRMPGMDGAELLTKVREQYGDTLRIVLTGQTAKEQVLRSLAVAHRVLNKPCDAILLESALVDADAMQKLVNNSAVRSLIDSVQELPAVPKLHLQLTELIKSGEFDSHQASKIVEQEPVIAGRVLQLVNSSFYSLAREVVSIHDAVSYLGADTLRGLVLNLELFSALESAKLAPNFSIEALQHHSLLSARIARSLCAEGQDPDLVYTSGLLHDIGQLIMAYVKPEDYNNAINKSVSQSVPLSKVELDTFGFTHADVSAYLLSLWDLPFSLIQVAGNHHLPSVTQESTLGPVGMVHIASEIAMSICNENYNVCFDQKYIAKLSLTEKVNEWLVSFTEAYSHD